MMPQLGDMRDYEKGCQVWDGKKWKHLSALNSREYNEAVFEYLNPRENDDR